MSVLNTATRGALVRHCREIITANHVRRNRAITWTIILVGGPALLLLVALVMLDGWAGWAWGSAGIVAGGLIAGMHALIQHRRMQDAFLEGLAPEICEAVGDIGFSLEARTVFPVDGFERVGAIPPSDFRVLEGVIAGRAQGIDFKFSGGRLIQSRRRMQSLGTTWSGDRLLRGRPNITAFKGVLGLFTLSRPVPTRLLVRPHDRSLRGRLARMSPVRPEWSLSPVEATHPSFDEHLTAYAEDPEQAATMLREGLAIDLARLADHLHNHEPARLKSIAMDADGLYLAMEWASNYLRAGGLFSRPSDSDAIIDRLVRDITLPLRLATVLQGRTPGR